MDFFSFKNINIFLSLHSKYFISSVFQIASVLETPHTHFFKSHISVFEALKSPKVTKLPPFNLALPRYVWRGPLFCVEHLLTSCGTLLCSFLDYRKWTQILVYTLWQPLICGISTRQISLVWIQHFPLSGCAHLSQVILFQQMFIECGPCARSKLEWGLGTVTHWAWCLQ